MKIFQTEILNKFSIAVQTMNRGVKFNKIKSKYFPFVIDDSEMNK